MFLTGRGGPLQCCPVCGASFMGNGLKHHLKPCARKALAQLTMCQHCGRPVQRDDLAEHKKRCQNKCVPGLSMTEETKKAFLEKTALLHKALSKIEAGMLGDLDQRGLFICSVCGEQGLSLDTVVTHENSCRARLACEGIAPPPSVQGSLAVGGCGGLFAKLAEIFAELRRQIETAEDKSEGAFAYCCEQLASVARNACEKEERKFRKLRLSNPVFHEAIGRWVAAGQFLEALGFELLDSASKGAPPEPRLVLTDPLPSEKLKIALSVLAGETSVAIDASFGSPNIADTTPDLVAIPEGVSSCIMALEECRYCHRKFRFDRIAKHETRCPESKPKPAKRDYIAAVLAGTIGEANIMEIRRNFNSGTKLPPLTKTTPAPATGECKRCGRLFGLDSLEKHMSNCRVQTADASNQSRKTNTSSTPRPKSSGAGPRSSDASKQRIRSASRHGQQPSSSSTSLQGTCRASSRDTNATMRRPLARKSASSFASETPATTSASDPMRDSVLGDSILGVESIRSEVLTTELESCDQSFSLGTSVPEFSSVAVDFAQLPLDLQNVSNTLADAVENEGVTQNAFLSDSMASNAHLAPLVSGASLLEPLYMQQPLIGYSDETYSALDNSMVDNTTPLGMEPLTHAAYESTASSMHPTSEMEIAESMAPLVGYQHLDPLSQPFTESIACGSNGELLQPLSVTNDGGAPEQITTQTHSTALHEVTTHQTPHVQLALPAGWDTYLDGEGRTYYGNAATGESSWLPPECTQHISMHNSENEARMSYIAGYEDLEVDVADWLTQD